MRKKGLGLVLDNIEQIGTKLEPINGSFLEAATSGLEIKKQGEDNKKILKGRSNIVLASYGGEEFFLKSAIPDGEGTEIGSPADNFFILSKQVLKEFFAIRIAKSIIPQVPDSKLFAVEDADQELSYNYLETGRTLIMVGLQRVNLKEKLPIREEIVAAVKEMSSRDEKNRQPVLIEQLASYKKLKDSAKSSLQKTLALSLIIGNNDLLSNLSLINDEALTTHDWGESFGFEALSIEDDLRSNRLTFQVSNQGPFFEFKPTLSIEPGIVKEVAETILKNSGKIYSECLKELSALGFTRQTGEEKSEMESRIEGVAKDFYQISIDRASKVLEILKQIEQDKLKQLLKPRGLAKDYSRKIPEAIESELPENKGIPKLEPIVGRSGVISEPVALSDVVGVRGGIIGPKPQFSLQPKYGLPLPPSDPQKEPINKGKAVKLPKLPPLLNNPGMAPGQPEGEALKTKKKSSKSSGQGQQI